MLNEMHSVHDVLSYPPDAMPHMLLIISWMIKTVDASLSYAVSSITSRLWFNYLVNVLVWSFNYPVLLRWKKQWSGLDCWCLKYHCNRADLGINLARLEHLGCLLEALALLLCSKYAIKIIFFIPVLISFYLSLQWSLAVASWKVLVITCSLYLDVSTSGC